MLSDEEIDKIINKERLNKVDVMLIHHHIDSIKKMNEDYPDGLPADVYTATQRDIGKIVDRLLIEKEYLANLNKGIEKDEVKQDKKPRLRLVDKD